MEGEFQQAYLKEIGVQTPTVALANTPQQAAIHTKPETTKPYNPDTAAAPTAVEEPAASALVEHDKPAAKPVTPVEGDLAALQVQASVCTACALAQSRNQVVFGEGNPQADLMFVAEAPHRDDDMQGKPLAGGVGVLFSRMLMALGMDRDAVYITHGVKCRPLHNRNPNPDEFAACEAFLSAQVAQVNPRMICVLGRVMAQHLLQTDANLSELRQGEYSWHGIPVRVIDHPAYLLRAQQHKRRAWQDLLRLKSEYQALIS